MNDKKIKEEIRDMTKQQTWAIPEKYLEEVAQKRKIYSNAKIHIRRRERKLKLAELEAEEKQDSLWDFLEAIVPNADHDNKDIAFSKDGKSICINRKTKMLACEMSTDQAIKFFNDVGRTFGK